MWPELRRPWPAGPDEWAARLIDDPVLAYRLRAACVAVYPMYKGVSRLVGMDIGDASAMVAAGLCLVDQGARAVVVPGKSHLSVVGDAFFKGAVTGFLGNRWLPA